MSSESLIENTAEIPHEVPHKLPPIQSSLGEEKKLAQSTSWISSAFHHSMASIHKTYGITADELSKIVDFDKRNEKEQVDALYKQVGGLATLAEKLSVDLEKGLITFLDRSGRTHVDGATEILGLKKTERVLSVENYMEAGKVKGQVVKSMTRGSQPTVRAVPLRNAAPVDRVVDEESRKEAFGINFIPPDPPEGLLSIVIGTIKDDTIIKVLLLGAVVTFIFGTILEPSKGWIEGMAIFVAVFIVLTVTAANDYSKERKFKKLLMMQSDKKVKVLRNGKSDQISSWDILVGDVVELAVGDEVAADGLYIDGSRLVVDESPLTGESLPIKKSSASPFMFSGCQVSEGSGRMLVTGIGARSTGGKIQQLLSESQKQETVLQLKLEKVAILVGKFGVSAGILVFLGALIRWIVLEAAAKPWEWSFLFHILEFFVLGVTMVVVAVPEGLPLAVTISLAFSMLKMIKDNCFIRHLSASETMGQATCICTDKTGTLTENRMTVSKFFLGMKEYVETEQLRFRKNTLPLDAARLLSESVSVNSTCFIKWEKNAKLPTFVGSATEGALLVLVGKLAFDYNEQRLNVKKIECGEHLFTSERKRMSSVVESPLKAPGKDGKWRVYSKGASEIMVSFCKYYLDADGKSVYELTAEDRTAILERIQAWAGEGLRTLVSAYRNVNPDEVDLEDPSTIERDLTLVSLFAIKDPVRVGVANAVRSCQEAGLKIRMVTGDNILTASTIARECNILTDGIAMEGPEFRALPLDQKKAIIPRLQVLARSSPYDKYTLVSILKSMDEVVAVTGDGTNDAPALKEADVGFAMGISGTQIAMNASDIVLLDDNFISLVQSIRWGRNVLRAVRMFLQFQLSVNIVAILLTFIGTIAADIEPLTAVQLLWVNLIMDTFGALALASEEPSNDILKQAPNSRSEPLMTKPMREYMIYQIIVQTIMLAWTLFQSEVVLSLAIDLSSLTAEEKLDHSNAFIFTLFVVLQVANETTSRQLNHQVNLFSGLFRNKLFLLIMCIILGVQAILINFTKGFVVRVSLTGLEWAVAFIGGAIALVYVTIVRCILAGIRIFNTRRNRVSPSPLEVVVVSV